MQQKFIILPKLCNCCGKVKKQWFVYYTVRDPRSGKMVRFRHYNGFTGLPEKEKYIHAQQLIEDYTIKLHSGWSPWKDATNIVYKDHLEYQTIRQLYDEKRVSNRTLRFVINQYIKFKEPGIARSSLHTYTSQFRIFTLWTEKTGMQLNDISTYTHSVIILFFQYLMNKRELSGKSIKKYSNLLHAFFNFCVGKKYIKKNPVYEIPKCTRVNDNTARPIMRQDMELFKEELQKDPELWLAVQFMYYCGLRPNREVRKLKLKDIDLVSGVIYVNRLNAKSRHERVTTIPRQFLSFLRENIDLRKWSREYYLFGRGGKPGPVPIGKNTLGYRFSKIRERLKMPREYKFYSWKHTAAVELDETNIPTKDISRHYGHSSIGITDIYLKNKKPSLSAAIRDNYPDL